MTSPKWNHIKGEAYKVGQRDALRPQKRKPVKWNLIAFCMALCLLARG